MRKFLSFCLVVWLQSNPLFSFGQDTTILEDTVLPSQTAETRIADSAFNILGPGQIVPVRSVKQRQMDSFLRQDDFWYANTAPKREKEVEEKQRGKSLLDRAWFRQLLWIIILSSFIAVVLGYLYSGNILVFRRRAKKITAEEGEEAAEDIFALNYETEIAKALSAKDFRLAVRLWYLQTLKELSDKGLIEYRFGRTNSHYVSQLVNTNYCHSFARLTRAFEYTWYGQFSLSPETYEMMQADFQNFKKALG
jgi:hypothetical protein